MHRHKNHRFRATLFILGLSVLSMAGIIPVAASAQSLDVNFGSNHDGLGDFIHRGWGSMVVRPDSVEYDGPSSIGNNRTTTFMTEALTGARVLSREAGSSYTFTSVIRYNSSTGRGASRNVSLLLFGDQVGTNAIALKMFERDTTFQIDLGPNNFSSSNFPAAVKNWGGRPFASGAVFTLEGRIRFTADDVFVTFTLTDDAPTPFSDTVTRTISKADLPGDFHGVGTRNQGLNFEVRNLKVDIPEPSSYGFLIGGLAGALVVSRRRRKSLGN